MRTERRKLKIGEVKLVFKFVKKFERKAGKNFFQPECSFQHFLSIFKLFMKLYCCFQIRKILHLLKYSFFINFVLSISSLINQPVANGQNLSLHSVPSIPGLFACEGQIHQVFTSQCWTFPSKEVSQSSMPHCGTPCQLHDDAWPQQWKKAANSSSCETLL